MTRTIASVTILAAASAAFGLFLVTEAGDGNSAMWMLLLLMAAATACAALVLVPLEWMLHIQIAAILITAYIPLSVAIGGLNLRASQMLFPFVLLRILTSGQLEKFSAPIGWFAIPAGAFWLILLGWTIVSLPEHTAPASGALGRVFLHALNMAQALTIAVLISLTRHWRQAVMTLLISVCVLNGVLLVCIIGQSAGISALERFTTAEDAPQLSGGAVAGGTVNRFVVGVITGCLSACALVLALASLVLTEHGKRYTYLTLAAGAMVGIVIGFSRQAVLDVAIGLALVGIIGFRKVNWKRTFAAAVAIPAIIVVLLAALSAIPLMQPYWQSFAGRTLVLADLSSYSQGTVNARLQMWSEMARDIVSNPLIGRGQDAYLEYYPAQGGGSHSFPLEVLHSAGLLGFAAYLWLHASVVRAGLRTARANREALPAGIFAGVVIVIISSCSNLIFWNPAYWLILALGTTAAYTGGYSKSPAEASLPGLDRELA
ncbi:MAG: O-antigen ligase family protein [Bryobacteraceae bacterium]|jgi:hypothetical protein